MHGEVQAPVGVTGRGPASSPLLYRPGSAAELTAARRGGAHFNPVVTLAAWFTGRHTADGLTLRDVAAYVPAQIAGAIGGAVLADAMFAKPLVQFSTHDRSAGHLWLGEVLATAGLILLIFGLGRIGRASLAPLAVASYIGAPTGSPPPPRSRTRQ